LIGTLAGRWLGGLVADLRYSPTPGSAPPKIHKGWVAAGALLGWVIGAAVGMGLTMVVERQVQARWLMPILFFQLQEGHARLTELQSHPPFADRDGKSGLHIAAQNC